VVRRRPPRVLREAYGRPTGEPVRAHPRPGLSLFGRGHSAALARARWPAPFAQNSAPSPAALVTRDRPLRAAYAPVSFHFGSTFVPGARPMRA
jgi:hypothetical protein